MRLWEDGVAEAEALDRASLKKDLTVGLLVDRKLPAAAAVEAELLTSSFALQLSADVALAELPLCDACLEKLLPLKLGDDSRSA